MRVRSGASLNFRLCDTRGLEESQGLDVLECNYMLDGHVPDFYQVQRFLHHTKLHFIFINSRVHCGYFPCKDLFLLEYKNHSIGCFKSYIPLSKKINGKVALGSVL